MMNQGFLFAFNTASGISGCTIVPDEFEIIEDPEFQYRKRYKWVHNKVCNEYGHKNFVQCFNTASGISGCTILYMAVRAVRACTGCFNTASGISGCTILGT